MTVSESRNSEELGALERLVNREEVLQICFWREGEGLGETCDAASIAPFLNCDATAIDDALRELVADGLLQSVRGSYKLTAKGKKCGGVLFADTFAENQRQGHGECPAGCCDGDDHSKCGDACALH